MILFLLTLVLILLIYSPTLNGQPIFDDTQLTINQDWSLASLKKWNFRYLVHLSFVLTMRFVPLRYHTQAIHLTNSLIHWLNSILVYFVVLSLTDQVTAAIASLLFSLSPLAASAVSPMLTRAGMLGCSFNLAALLLALTGHGEAAIPVSLLSLLAKEDAIVGLVPILALTGRLHFLLALPFLFLIPGVRAELKRLAGIRGDSGMINAGLSGSLPLLQHWLVSIRENPVRWLGWVIGLGQNQDPLLDKFSLKSIRLWISVFLLLAASAVLLISFLGSNSMAIGAHDVALRDLSQQNLPVFQHDSRDDKGFLSRISMIKIHSTGWESISTIQAWSVFHQTDDMNRIFKTSHAMTSYNLSSIWRSPISSHSMTISASITAISSSWMSVLWNWLIAVFTFFIHSIYYHRIVIRVALLTLLLSPWVASWFIPLPDSVAEQRAYSTVFSFALLFSFFPIVTILPLSLWMAVAAAKRAFLQRHPIPYWLSCWSEKRPKLRVAINIGAAYQMIPDIENAGLWHRKALGIAPRNGIALANLGLWFEGMAKLSRGQIAQGFVETGRIDQQEAMRLGAQADLQRKEAIRLLNEAIKEAPKDVWVQHFHQIIVGQTAGLEAPSQPEQTVVQS